MENIAQNLMIIVGIILYILGIIGNIFNICVFTIWSRLFRRVNRNTAVTRTNNSSLYLLTSSREVRLRRLSPTKHQTKLILLILICLIGLHSIPLGVYFEVSNLGQCTIISKSFSIYYLYVFQIFLHGIFPIVFHLIFGILTYKQLRMIHIHFDKQFSSTIVFLYHIIATILFYLNPVSSFYVYFISTPNFRRQIWKFLCWNKDEHHFNNQINVITVSK